MRTRRGLIALKPFALAILVLGTGAAPSWSCDKHPMPSTAVKHSGAGSNPQSLTVPAIRGIKDQVLCPVDGVALGTKGNPVPVEVVSDFTPKQTFIQRVFGIKPEQNVVRESFLVCSDGCVKAARQDSSRYWIAVYAERHRQTDMVEKPTQPSAAPNCTDGCCK